MTEQLKSLIVKAVGAVLSENTLACDDVLIEIETPKDTKFGDFSINISGAIYSNSPNEYPSEPVNNLINILRIPLPLELTSEFLNRFGIVSAVVDSYDFPQTKGVRNFQPFNITLSSDELAEIQINEEEETVEARSGGGSEDEGTGTALV